MYQAKEAKKMKKWVCQMCAAKKRHLSEVSRGNSRRCRARVYRLNNKQARLAPSNYVVLDGASSSAAMDQPCCSYAAPRGDGSSSAPDSQPGYSGGVAARGECSSSAGPSSTWGLYLAGSEPGGSGAGDVFMSPEVSAANILLSLSKRARLSTAAQGALPLANGDVAQAGPASGGEPEPEPDWRSRKDRGVDF